MATFYDKYARMEVLASGSDVDHAASTCTLFASGTAAGATLYFFKGDGTKVDMAGGSTLTADGDSGGTVSVDLSTDTFDIAGGTGCDTTIAKVGTNVTLTVDLDMGEITGADIDVGTDFGIFIDGGATGTTRKDSWADIATAQAGTVTTTGLAASSGVFKWDLQNWTASTTIADADLIGIDDGAGGTLRKMTRGNFLGAASAAFSNGLTATTISGSSTLDVAGIARFGADNQLTVSAAGVLSGSATATLANATLDQVTVGSADINGGAVDGTTIGASSQSSGKFTTISGSSTLDVAGIARFGASNQLTVSAVGLLSGSATATLANATFDQATVGSVDINGGAIDGAVIGANSAAAGTFAALVGTSLSVSDGNITNVGVLECDTVQSDADASGLNINFDGNTGTNLISMANSLASALDITQGGNSFLKFDTTNDYTTAGKEFFMSAGTSVGASGWIRFGNNSSSPDSSIAQVDNGKYKALVISGSSGADGLSGTGLTYVSGNLSASGDVSLGLSTSDTVYVNGVIGTALMPNSDDSYDLGHASYQWQDLYIDGKAYIDQLGEALDCDDNAMTNVNVDSGAIDGTTIGASSQSSGKFTTISGSSTLDVAGIARFGASNQLTVSAVGLLSGSATATLANATLDQITVGSADINGGAIDGTTIGASSAAAGTFAALKATTVSGTVGSLTSLKVHSTIGTTDDTNLLTLGAGATSMLTVSGNVEFGGPAAGTNFTMYGSAANEKVAYNAGNHNLVWTDSGGSTHLTIGGDANGEYAIDVATGSNAKNKVRAAAFVTYSDERLKSDVKPLRNALKTVNSLKAVNFTWKTDGGNDFGFLAQDLQKVIPQAVHGNDKGFFGVDYGRLTAVLVSAIQEQSLEIEALKAKMKKD